MTAPRPTIGITSYWTHAEMAHWDLDAVLVGQGYVEGVRLAGGRALVLPADPLWADHPGDALDHLDGLLVVGGDDVAPEEYGCDRHPATGARHPRRDAVELGLVRGALARSMPVLGICRGIHVLNVARGGTLVQHLPERVEITPHRAGDRSFGEHTVEVAAGSLLSTVIGAGGLVSSHHHQGIDRIGAGLACVARAPDGVIEALEDPALPFCLGVLWHPDADPAGSGAPLFGGLVAAAALSSART
ncbi:MAG TPA: gamma-glutamyl-gamma-aminobutyrate hydrolase family protein [Gaiellales bacterium]|nr:gamma-glutamyl-gamma-aminobutyrate hydrolase family protein [Gaiellales bacterium]